MEITDILLLVTLFGGGLNFGALLQNFFGGNTNTVPEEPSIRDTYISADDTVLTADQMAYNERQALNEAEIQRQQAAANQAAAQAADEANDLGDTLIGVGAGAAGGAAIGSLIFPGLGTGIGAGIGALGGWLVSLWAT